MTFEAGAAEVNAGHVVRRRARRPRALPRGARSTTSRCCGSCRSSRRCSAPGVYRGNPRGLLDLLLAGMADRRLHIAGVDRPGRRTSGSCGRGRRCGTRSTSCACEPMDEPRTLALAERAAPGTGPRRAARGAGARPPLPRRRRAAGRAALAAGDDAPAPRGRRAAGARRRAGHDLRALRAAAVAARRPRAARRRRAALVLLPARDRAARGGRVRRRADRAAEGGAGRPDAPAGGAAVRRPDRHGQDRDRQVAGRVPVRLGRPDDPDRPVASTRTPAARAGCSATTTTSAATRRW